MYGMDGTAGGRTTAAFVATPTWVQNITVNKKLIITAMIAIPTWSLMEMNSPYFVCRANSQAITQPWTRGLNDCPEKHCDADHKMSHLRLEPGVRSAEIWRGLGSSPRQ